VSTGHKAGGFNDTSGGNLFNSEYRPESVIAFELGSKNTLLDRRLRLNASAFYYRYNDQVFQTIVSVTPPDEDGMGGSNTAVRANASTSNILGLDLDVVYSLPAGLEAEVHALFMDARFGDGVEVHDARLGFDISEYPVDIGGNWLPRVSPVTLNYALSQMIFTEAGTFDWIVSGQTRTRQYQTVFNGEGELLPPVRGELPTTDSYAALQDNPARLTDVIEAYTHFNLGAGWRHPDGRLSLSGFVNNVANVAYPTSIIATPGLNLRFFNPPRTAGVRMRVDW
jgi:iron complex outermembrane receptor protein